jgi:hypothetical protein
MSGETNLERCANTAPLVPFQHSARDIVRRNALLAYGEAAALVELRFMTFEELERAYAELRQQSVAVRSYL